MNISNIQTSYGCCHCYCVSQPRNCSNPACPSCPNQKACCKCGQASGGWPNWPNYGPVWLGSGNVMCETMKGSTTMALQAGDIEPNKH